MAAVLGNRREVEEQRAPRPSTQARRPFDGVAVANAVRRRLGVPLPGEPARELPRPGGPPSAGPSNN